MSSIFQRRDSTVCAIKSSTTSLSLFCDLNESGSGHSHSPAHPSSPTSGRAPKLFELVGGVLCWGKRLSAGLVARRFSWFPRASHECGPVSPQSPSREALSALRISLASFLTKLFVEASGIISSTFRHSTCNFK
ncbi:hypothetical protein AVEN_110274-1 [Araneus ventricosus]|uniref:Uncharacterized protein n=1 Tax=Araneus ventricosus TaxID=182803 RepID=A0A4Y2DP58_ARAVE|nr:hypothetical protein AVEN_110274-1 [Araneus ventricosus]